MTDNSFDNLLKKYEIDLGYKVGDLCQVISGKYKGLEVVVVSLNSFAYCKSISGCYYYFVPSILEKICV
jgi:hypothetical protein